MTGTLCPNVPGSSLIQISPRKRHHLQVYGGHVTQPNLTSDTNLHHLHHVYNICYVYHIHHRHQLYYLYYPHSLHRLHHHCLIDQPPRRNIVNGSRG